MRPSAPGDLSCSSAGGRSTVVVRIIISMEYSLRAAKCLSRSRLLSQGSKREEFLLRVACLLHKALVNPKP